MQKRDIVVIGAGLTGLSTAFNLKKMGRDVLVLEKQNRIGGQIALSCSVIWRDAARWRQPVNRRSAD